ncbi:MAG: succinate dehydrogenase iron-sulfur subunit [Nitrospirae bacterium]|nr:succinate dehydrogenase iron-sulfur subunit [Nitrospirota bacterium]
MKDYTFRISRFSPARDATPYFREYKLRLGDSSTVLDALFYIFKNLDPTLGFRFSCRGSVCGSCAMKINGGHRLACETQASGLGNLITISPVSNLPVIKDLIVDMEHFWKNYRAIKPFLVFNSSGREEHIVSPHERKRLNGLVECILCGICFSSCPVTGLDENYLGPAALLKLARFLEKERGETRERLYPGITRHGVWSCRKAYNCQESCPKNLSPAKAVRNIIFKTAGKAFRK